MIKLSEEQLADIIKAELVACAYWADAKTVRLRIDYAAQRLARLFVRWSPSEEKQE